MIFYGDLETYCETPIRHGTYRYAEDAEVMVVSLAIDDGPVEVWDVQDRPDWRDDLREYFALADEIVFHNSSFDRAVLRENDVEIPLPKLRDTRVQALSHSLPGGLDILCRLMNVPLDEAKLETGHKLIQLFCKPRPKNSKIRRATRESHPAEWAQFLDYAGHDISAMRFIRKKLPTWNYTGDALALWHLDQRINDRGVQMDLDMVNAALAAVKRERARLSKRTKEITNDEVGSTSQRDKLLEYLLAEHGVSLPDMKSDTIERRLEDEDLPRAVKELLLNRMEATRASLAKYSAILRGVSKDGRVRGTIQFNGAMRTGRWSHKLVQLGNLMRTPKYLAGDEGVNEAREAIKAGHVDLVYEKPMEVLSAAVPWTIVAPRGKKIIAVDLSQIESRSLAWHAGEDWRVEVFKHYDDNKKDLTRDPYIIGYTRTFAADIREVIRDYEQGGKLRQIGKVLELALGYQGYIGAFISMAAVYRIDLSVLAGLYDRLPPEMKESGEKAWRRAQDKHQTFGLDKNVYIVCHCSVMMWRAASPATVQFWWDLQAACREAIKMPGMLFNVGRLRIRSRGPWLGIEIPSGHTLCYPNPKVKDGQIFYSGQNQYTRKWSTISTYGGKIAQNVMEATATGSGGILGRSMPAVEEAGYEIITHSHDELVVEAPDSDDYSVADLGNIFTAGHDWTAGLPMSFDGYESRFYRKD